MPEKKALIIGAGPAGLTAAYELLKNTDIKPIIFEATGDIGGISKTVNYKGNRIDIGGHRFFSKSDTVMSWWANIFPKQVDNLKEIEKGDLKCMLVRNRLSRILYNGKFFDYPVTLNKRTIVNLGVWNIIKIGFSYIKAKLSPRKEHSLEDFLINRFGRELYQTFFENYTEKVWGEPCSKISAEWGAQRIKGISILSVLKNALKSIFSKKVTDISQKNVETSLITRFLYPPHGPGQLWEQVAKLVREKGGEIHLNQKIVGIFSEKDRVNKLKWEDKDGKHGEIHGDYIISTMPIKDLIKSWHGHVPSYVKEIAGGLMYRDFVTVGLLLKKLNIKSVKGHEVLDNWIYIQEPQVKIGRLQIFNNWSPFMVKNPDHIWIGLEYFCYEDDEIWNMPEKEMADFAIDEIDRINIIDKKDVLDSVVIKMEKTYPAYFGTYDQIGKVRKFVDHYENLFLIGRNGMHKYNNMDHSMLTAMEAVKNIANSKKTKDNIWGVNVEKKYHETKTKSV